MDVYSGTARQTLHLPGDENAPAPNTPWAQFDAAWYRAAYTDAPDGTPAEILAWYLAHGQALGHSPTRWFDEAWQREAWDGIAAAIQAGTFSSAFDAWCQIAHFVRPPHWLFDPREYRRRYPTLTQEELLEAGLLNHYDHFLRFGAREHRICHPLFDPWVYLADLDPDERAAAGADPLQHYLTTRATAAPEHRTSPLFDPDWYAAAYPEAVRAVAAGRYGSLLEHYLRNETPAAFNPSAWFSEAWYLQKSPGLADAIGPGKFRNSFAHFLAHGREEGRTPHPDLDLAWYADLERVRADIGAGRAKDAYLHWLEIGEPAGLAGAPGERPAPTPEAGAALAAIQAATIATVLGRRKRRFGPGAAPALGIVMRAGPDAAATARALASAWAGYGAPIDAVLIAAGDPEIAAALDFYIEGATVLRFDTAVDSVAAREAGILASAATEAILFLDDGMELGPDAVAAALERFRANPDAGAIGARIATPHGPLAEAGGIVWRDGALQPYMAGESPLAAEANFVREVDYCAASCLFVRRQVLASLPAGSPDLAGTTHESADLCARIREAGFRIVYDPAVLAFQTRRAPTRRASGRAAFVRDHAALLARQPDRRETTVLRARSVERGQRRVLFVEDSVPLRRIGSGFVRSNDIVHAMAAAGIEVTVFPIAASRFPLPLLLGEMPPEVEIAHNSAVADFAGFLDARLDHYDTIWVARTHNLDKIHDTLTAAAAKAARPPRIVLDTEAVASLREAGHAAILGAPFDLDAALAHEFRHFGPDMDIVAVTDSEAAILRRRYGGQPATIGHALAGAPTPATFEARSGILFAAAFHGMDHPNYDGLVWFVDEVLPLIERALRWETRLTVAGYIAPHVTLARFQDHPRVTLRGPAADFRPLYNTHRVAIAPARFAAGIPYKVHEAAAMGLPTVATGLLSRQLGWPDGEGLSAAEATDPAGFARRVIALYQDSQHWTRQRDLALAHVAADLDPGRFAAQVAALAGRARPEVEARVVLTPAPGHLNTSPPAEIPLAGADETSKFLSIT